MESQKIKDAIVLCTFLPFKNEMESIYFKVLSSAIAANEEKRSMQMFNHSFMERKLSEIDGTVPTHLVEKEKFVMDLYSLASSGKLKSFLRSVLDHVKSEKEYFIKEFEEIAER